MHTITQFEDIEAWKTARELTIDTDDLCADRTRSICKRLWIEKSISCASVSVMSNIAEGFESRTQAQFLEYLGRSKASAGEVRCQLYIALDLKYLSQEHFDPVFELADKSSRQIARFMDYLETHPQSRRVRDEGSEYEV